MSLIKEIISVILLQIVIYIIYVIVSKKAKNLIDNKKISKEKINSLKNAILLIFGVIAFLTILDIYNVFCVDTDNYIHLLGVINFAKINTGYLNNLFIFSLGQFLIYMEIVIMLIVNSNKKRILVTIISVLLYIGLCIYRLYDVYVFYNDAKEYEYLNDYDIYADFEEDDEISEDGAIKIAEDYFETTYIRNVTAELVNLDDIDNTTIKYACDFEDFWIISFEYMKNNEIIKDICVYVDLYTGQISYITY